MPTDTARRVAVVHVVFQVRDDYGRRRQGPKLGGIGWKILEAKIDDASAVFSLGTLQKLIHGTCLRPQIVTPFLSPLTTLEPMAGRSSA
jgi:hypothetical protein